LRELKNQVIANLSVLHMTCLTAVQPSEWHWNTQVAFLIHFFFKIFAGQTWLIWILCH